MFLLDKKPTIIEKPWKLAMIDDCLPTDVADHLASNYPEFNRPTRHGPRPARIETQDTGPYLKTSAAAHLDDEVFKHFFIENWSRKKELNEIAHEVLGIKESDNCEIERWNWMYAPPSDRTEEIRPWHVDQPEKKLQFILYLGDNTDFTTFEARYGLNGETQFTMPFKHNRLIFWQAGIQTYHRFFYTEKDRKTLNLSSVIKNSGANNKETDNIYEYITNGS